MKKIVFCGFSGCGKTFLGKKRAKELSIPFFDLDDLIEKHHNKKISDIFSLYGEDVFRESEHKVLKMLLDNKQNFVLSLGGGTVCFYDNLNLLKNNGCKIYYIKRNIDFLYKALCENKENRPLIKNLKDDELLKYIQDTLLEREIFYLQADYIIFPEPTDL